MKNRDGLNYQEYGARKNRPVIILLIALCCWSAGFAQMAEHGTVAKETAADLHEVVSPVTVRIVCAGGNRSGSGVIVGVTDKGQAIILTALHVIQDMEHSSAVYDDITVTFPGTIGTVRGVASGDYVNGDIALLWTEKEVDVDKIATFFYAREIRHGNVVTAFGFPVGSKDLTETTGRIIRIEDQLIVSDAEVVAGNSGGPIVDQYGRMVAMADSVREFSGRQNESYGITVDVIAPIVDRWFTSLKPARRWEYGRYGSIWEHCYRDPVYIASEALIAAGVVYLLVRPTDGGVSPGGGAVTQPFGPPPDPPKP